MATRKINGVNLDQMLNNGLANLAKHEDELNRLNVFPVPDGDTGTNMRMTLAHALESASVSDHAGEYLASLSDGMLLGARGNSGVILSQFFKGFYQELSRCSVLGPGELRNGLIRGYRIAYRAVINPVEGTILSVAREGIEHIRSQIGRSTTIDSILAMYVAEMKKTLTFTPDMLSVLKEAGVVDSGAYGFILIFEGMLKFLTGDYIDPGRKIESGAGKKSVDFSLFDENSVFTDGYCMEFILQLMRGDDYSDTFKLQGYIDSLKKRGESIVCVQDGTRVKVHIHTKTPAPIIHISQKYGEFLTFKLENMQIQHNEHDRETGSAPRKPLSVVSVVSGEGLKKLFSDLGSDCVIDGGDKMNTSSKEFVDAFERLNADAIVVLPNNKNIIRAAQQAAKLAKGKNVTVLPTESFADGYFALAMDIQDSDDTERRIAQMKRGIADVVTLSETTASRDYSYHEISCKKGDQIVLKNGDLACVANDPVGAMVYALGLVEGMEDRETCVIFCGKERDEELNGKLEEELSYRYPMTDVSFIDGGQEIYRWIAGIG
ncbi:MAG: DAK2 domain-containing protein [Clostridia bacterium]|nr:DAK2 domain-containing protein [Clostridia bacterium]